jgi:hypothetical protein
MAAFPIEQLVPAAPCAPVCADTEVFIANAATAVIALLTAKIPATAMQPSTRSNQVPRLHPTGTSTLLDSKSCDRLAALAALFLDQGGDVGDGLFAPLAKLCRRLGVLTGMRVVMRLVLVGSTLSLGLLPGLSVAATKQRSLVLHLRWRLVTAEPNFAAASDRYVAIIKDRYPTPSVLTLLDQQAHEQRQLTAPGCSRPLNPMVGGPWLFVTCSYGAYELYNLTSQQWMPVALSSQCAGACNPVAVGRYWIKIDTGEGPGCGDHCSDHYFLQNIATGQLKPDPVTAGGRRFDNLDSPAGLAPLCAPLRYPRIYNGAGGGWQPGRLSFAGSFALAEGAIGLQRLPPFTLERCNSTVRRSESESFQSNSPALLSSRAMAWTYRSSQPPHASFRLGGWLLPRLQRFTAALPAPLRGQNGAVIAALSQRTVYVRTYYRYAQLWAASLPGPPKPRPRR